MLPSEIIRRVREIQVRTGRQVADVLAGEYISVFRGSGIEFDEVRPYLPGDDIRTIDWNVTARMGEPFVKRYVEERQLTLTLLADISASQEFGSGNRSKREAAAEICALLAFSAIQNDDKVGLTLFHDEIEQFIPPRKGQRHALRVVREVLAHGQDERRRPKSLTSRTIGRRGRPAGAPKRRGGRRGTSIQGALEFFLSVTPRKSVCFVVSDFMDSGWESALRSANRKHDVIAVLITDPRETEIPNVGIVALDDAETGRRTLVDSGKPAFRRKVEELSLARIEALRSQLTALVDRLDPRRCIRIGGRSVGEVLQSTREEDAPMIDRQSLKQWRSTALFLALISLALVASSGGPLRAQAQESPAAEAESAPPEVPTIAKTSTLGPVTAVITLSPAEPVIGDPLTLTIEVTAEPDVEVLMPAFGEALGSFSILSFTPREQITEDGRTLQSQTYSLDAPMSGEWAIPRLVVEFVDGRAGNRPAPEGDDAYELLTETMEFTVESVLPTDAEAELHPFLDPLDPLPTRLEKAEPFIWGGVFLFLIIPLAIWLVHRARRRGRRRSAYDIAVSRLRKLQKAPRTTPAEIQAFYVEISAVVRRYLEDRFVIRAPESTTEEFLDRASRSSVLTGEHSELLVRFLQQADLVKFAGSIPGDLEIADSVRSAERFLEETREDAPMLEVAEGSPL